LIQTIVNLFAYPGRGSAGSRTPARAGFETTRTALLFLPASGDPLSWRMVEKSRAILWADVLTRPAGLADPE